MKKKNESKDMIISLKRMGDIILQYWWIVLATTLLMGIVVLAQGKHEVGEDNSVQSLVLISIQAEDLVDEKYLQNFLIDGRSEYTTSQSMVRDVLAIYNSNEIAGKIQTAMVGKGYADANASDAVVENIEYTRIINITANSGNTESDTQLVNLIADELVDITTNKLGLPGARVLNRAEISQELKDATVAYTFITKMNLALIAVGIFLGCLCLGILIVIDGRVRSRVEVDWCYEGNYIGTFSRKKSADSVQRIGKGIYGLLNRNGKSSTILVSVEQECTFVPALTQVDTDKKISFIPSALKNTQGLEQIGKADSVVLAIALHKTKFSDLDELIYTIRNMNILINGYILIK